MMKASPTASFVVTQAEFLLQLLIVAFDDPAMFGQVHQVHQGDIGRYSRQPILGWFGFSGWPFDEQPFFWMRLRPLLLAMRGTYSEDGETRLQFVLYPLPPRYLLPNIGR